MWWLILCLVPLVRAGQGESSLCSEQHFCSCPPFLRSKVKPDSALHFVKHNYRDQFAIVGKSKEIHCCVGPQYDSLEWFKDDQPFPWEERDRNIIIYSNNQSMIMMEARPQDSGVYRCVARLGQETLEHSTNLSSFPAPVFAHPPIWNIPPKDVGSRLGEKIHLTCSAIVGQQYNTVSMEPVHAAWIRFGRELATGHGTKVSQEWDHEDIVTHLRVEISAVELTDSGDYTCRVQNQYGVLERTVRLDISQGQGSVVEQEMKREMQGLFKKQMKIFSHLVKISSQDPVESVAIIKEAEKKLHFP